MRQVLLDTDILSYVTEDRYPQVSATAKQYYRVFRYFSVSSITVCEAVQGFANNRDTEGIADFLKRVDGFEVLGLGTEEAILAARIFAELKLAGRKIGAMDPFNAAVAIVNERPLVTNNVGHFRRIVELGFPLELENWLDGD